MLKPGQGGIADGRLKMPSTEPFSNTGNTPASSPSEEVFTDENKLLGRITVNPKILGGKPVIRGRRPAVEHGLVMLAAGDTPETILKGYPWLQMEDIQACLVYACRMVSQERVKTPLVGTGT